MTTDLTMRVNVRTTTWYDLCYKRTVVVDVCVISYECIRSVCSMPIAAIGNALTIVPFCDQSICYFFTPFKAGIHLELPVPGPSVSSVQPYRYPERL